MKAATTVCGRCGAKVSDDATQEVCPACLLESGLGLLDDESVAGVADPGHAEGGRAADKKKSTQSGRMLADFGDYALLEEIGRGGQGVVYRAYQKSLNRTVALKVIGLGPWTTEAHLKRFRREAEAAASLEYPCIVPVYEVGELDGSCYFSMKFVEGGRLDEAVKRTPMSIRRAVELIAKLARTVHYAHEHGVLHRDIKPGNILLDAQGEPLLTDFGLAGLMEAESTITRTLDVMGTPSYMAPEQAAGEHNKLSKATDIYGLGAVLYQLLTDHPPFAGGTSYETIRLLLNTEPRQPRQLNSKIDRDLSTICLKCLDKDPQRRYPSALALAEDLERWLESRPISARPVSPPERVWRWSKRNPKLASSIAACLLAITAAAVWQTQSRHLAATVREGQLAAHSLTVFPVLDLDDVTITSPRAIDATNHLVETLRNVSSIRVQTFPLAQAEARDFSWKESDLRRAVLNSGSRALLLGTVRRHNATLKAVLNVIDATNGRLLAQQLVSAGEPTASTLFSPATAQSIWSEWTKNTASDHPRYIHTDIQSATKIQVARDYLVAGDDFFVRRSVEDVDRAIECYRKAIAADPQCALALASLASATAMRIQISTSDPLALVEAEKMAKHAAELDPLLSEAHRAEAVCHWIAGRYQEASEEATAAFELNPTYQRAVGLLAVATNEMGRPDVALRWFHWGQRLQSQPGEYESGIAMALVLLGEYNEAENVLRQGAQFRPDFPYHDILLAILRLQQSRFEEAQKIAQEVAARFPSNIETIQISAEANLFAGQLARAEELYQKLLRQDRRGGLFVSGLSYLSAIGWICLQTGREAEGRELLSEAEKNDREFLETAPRHSQRIYSLAATVAALGRDDEALALLGKAIPAGWINYRYMQIDPRFHHLRDNKDFKQLLSDLEKRIEELRRQRPAEKMAFND